MKKLLVLLMVLINVSLQSMDKTNEEQQASAKQFVEKISKEFSDWFKSERPGIKDEYAKLGEIIEAELKKNTVATAEFLAYLQNNSAEAAKYFKGLVVTTINVLDCQKIINDYKQLLARAIGLSAEEKRARWEKFIELVQKIPREEDEQVAFSEALIKEARENLATYDSKPVVHLPFCSLQLLQTGGIFAGVFGVVWILSEITKRCSTQKHKGSSALN